MALGLFLRGRVERYLKDLSKRRSVTRDFIRMRSDGKEGDSSREGRHSRSLSIEKRGMGYISGRKKRRGVFLYPRP